MPKMIAILAIVLFSIIGLAAAFKSIKSTPTETIEVTAPPTQEIELAQETRVVTPQLQTQPQNIQTNHQTTLSDHTSEAEDPNEDAEVEKEKLAQSSLPRSADGLPSADIIDQLFNINDPKLPIVETIVYKSRVAWQKGRPAWLSDYASHYDTSRHFIARSLNGKADYLKQDVADGNKFNVLRSDKNYQFYLLIDTSRCKLWFYYVDNGTNERVLLKTYDVGLGRFDSTKASGSLTPLGKYSLGNKVAIYQPSTMGNYHGEKTEMIRIFGTRWIPFEKELGDTTAPAKGFGIHGVPWQPDSNGKLAENTGSIGKYESDGCVRLATKDIEEIFAIIITKPSSIELVADFHDAKLPGKEKAR
jgi:hypothetical protein